MDELRSEIRKSRVPIATPGFLPIAVRNAALHGATALVMPSRWEGFGLPVLEVPDLEADSGDEIEIDLKAGIVKNLTKATEYKASAMPQVMIDILDQGGLVSYLKKNGTYDASAL